MITTEQKQWTKEKGWAQISKESLVDKPQLVLVFGGREVLENPTSYSDVNNFYPDAHIISCSTAGEILDNQVTDNTLAVTAIHFGTSDLRFGQVNVSDARESYAKGKELAGMLDHTGLVHALVFSDGSRVNGTSLVKGLSEVFPRHVSVTGGLVGDGANFKKTLVGFDGVAEEGKIVIVGLYGEHIRIGYGSIGGWDAFGPERIITKSKDNVLYELDNKPALGLYKSYLGEQAKGLPSTGLLFPLMLRQTIESGAEVQVVRTILAVDEAAQSMTFAGDMPEGIPAKLMKANFERLIDGAGRAASVSMEPLGVSKPTLALLVSCVGRKLVLKERTEEEIDAVRKVVGDQAAIMGFYSYGEICPTAASEKQCQLHNQTMTITTFREE